MLHLNSKNTICENASALQLAGKIHPTTKANEFWNETIGIASIPLQLLPFPIFIPTIREMWKIVSFHRLNYNKY